MLAPVACAIDAALRALTIRQPWAWAIAVAGKDVENRGWPTSYRGLLAIHAGKGEDDPYGLPDDARRTFLQAATLPATALGAVVAVVDLVDCHRHDATGADAGGGRHRWLSLDDDRCSEWAVPGQWHWQLTSVRPLARPVPCRGSLGLWQLPPDAEAEVRAQLTDKETPNG